MKLQNRFHSPILTGLLLVSSACVAADEAPAGDVGALPLQPTRSVSFTTDEGSWLDLDLSPDGRTIIFELLGDLYLLPVAGGKARRITSGAVYDSLPRFSPDGQRVLFVSDRDGGDNIWIANADGSGPRRITRGQTNTFRSLEWSPDGNVVASQARQGEYSGHSPFPWRPYLSFGDQIFFYDLRNDKRSIVDIKGVALAPAFGSDPRYMYASVYGQTSYSSAPDWKVVRFDRVTATTSEIGVETRAVQPVVSPDNTWLVYGTRHEQGTGLRLRNLETGDERWLRTGLRRDAGTRSSSRGLMPGAAFTPDSRAVILYDKGKLWRVAIASDEAAMIPFVADVDIPVGPLARFSYRIQDDRGIL